MEQKKEIRINKVIVKRLILTFLISYSTVVAVQHFGNFFFIGSDIHYQGFTSPFGYTDNFSIERQYRTIELYGGKKKRQEYGDLTYLGRDLPHYLKSSLVHIQYTFLVWIVVNIVIVIRKKYKFKLK